MANETATPENPAQTMLKAVVELDHHDEIVGLDAPGGNQGIFTTDYQITLPKSREIHDLTEVMRQSAQFLKPARRTGTAILTDLGSMADWANRFKGDSSMLFANLDPDEPSMTCIADYHAEGPVTVTSPDGDPTARHCHHRAVYKFPVSDEWKAWTSIAKEPMGKDELGEFIEQHAIDIMDPTPAIIQGKTSDKNADWENRLIETAQMIDGKYGQLSQLLKLSKTFQIHETSNLTVTSNRNTGEAEVRFLNEHKTPEGAAIDLPNLIIIAIPVFEGGALYRMPVRFWYRKRGGTITFFLTPYNPEKAFKAAATEGIEHVRKETGLPLLMGSPESY